MRLESLEARAMLDGDGIDFGPPAPPEVDEAIFGDFPNEISADAPYLEADFGLPAMGRVDSTDVDFIQFTASYDNVTIESYPDNPDLLLQLRLFDESGEQLAVVDADQGNGMTPGAPELPVFMTVPTSPGELYYLSMQSTEETVGGYATYVYGFDNPPGPDSPLGEDIHSDVRDETATLLDLDTGGYVFSNVDTESDIDVFRFTPAGDIMNISVESELPLNVQVHLGDGEVLDANGLRFTELDATIGEEYFISVTSTTDEVGQYQLSVGDNSFGPDMEGDTIDDAVPLELYGDGQAELFGFINTADDVDVFGFVANGPTSEVSAFLLEAAPIGIRILDASGEEIASSGPTDDGILPHDAAVAFDSIEGEQYFIELSSPGEAIGMYIGQVTSTPEIIIDPPDPDPSIDQVGDTIDEATFLNFGTGSISVTEAIQTADDHDVYGFEANGDVVYLNLFALDGSESLQLDVYDSDGDAIELNGFELNEDFPFLPMEVNFEAIIGETYFLDVSALPSDAAIPFAAIPYELSLFVEPDIDPPPVEDVEGDTISDAVNLELGPAGDAPIVGVLNDDEDVDVFGFVAVGSETEISLFLTTAEGVNVRVLDSAGEPVPGAEFTEDGPDGSEARIVFESVPGDQYFIEISSDGDSGLYLGQLLSTPDIIIDPPGPIVDQVGDTIDQATFVDLEFEAINLGELIQTAEDHDVYGFEANGTSVSLSLFGSSDLRADVFNSQGETVEVDWTDLGIIPELGILLPHEGFFESVPGETYYVDVSAVVSDAAVLFEPLRYNLHIFSPFEMPPPVFGEPDSELGDDIHGGELDSATVLEPGQQEINSNIDSPGDRDVFKLQAVGNGITFEAFTEAATLHLTLLDADGGLIFDSNELVFPDEFPIVGPNPYENTVETTPGEEYYLLVESNDPEAIGQYHVGMYTFVIDPPPPILEDLVGDTLEDATEIVFEEDVVIVDAFINTRDDIDVYKFTSEGTEVYFDFIAHGPIAMAINVYDEGGNILEDVQIFGMTDDGLEIDPEGFSPLVEGIIPATPGETYYVSIASANDAIGGYTMHLFSPVLVTEPIDPIDPIDPGGAPEDFVQRAGDTDGDGDIDSLDSNNMATYWTGALAPGSGDRTWEHGDMDGDGDVDSLDRTLMAQNWTGAKQASKAENAAETDDLFASSALDDVLKPSGGFFLA